ncbi:hypothetical protein DL89DRAFT_270878 [Linderina pennispora]|uniref:Uncharacterized protein n=1 Tax=Linderina pennispora TaxID=61395 RepID=A0A1Y1VWX3_9FUNG|nr:uncharacterized protein DL89DRAFT_270878 [Linderina pennispora]ORX65515.1 hypothetical protein DL89DRAFT_270878 [Linderina pennispora]
MQGNFSPQAKLHRGHRNYPSHNAQSTRNPPPRTNQNYANPTQQHPQHQRTTGGMFGKLRMFVENVADAFDNPSPTRRDMLVDHWSRIQEYYTPQNQDDLRKLEVTDTTIPYHLESALRLLALEMLETADHEADGIAKEHLAQPLEFGPCIEYLLQYHVLNSLVEFADADLPRGMRKNVLHFFGIFIECIPLGLLPESAIRLPLVEIMRQCLNVVQTSPTTLINPMRRQEPMAGSSTTTVGSVYSSIGRKQGKQSSATTNRLGQGYHCIPNDKTAVILCHDLLKLVVSLFTRLREHSNMVYLFFDWGSEWQTTAKSADLAVASLRTATSDYKQQSARGHEMLIMHVIVEYLLAPGMTGQLAREALVLVVQVLLAPKDKDKYVDFLLDRARIAELLVEHLGYLHSQMPVYRPIPRTPNSQLFRNDYTGGRTMPPLTRRMHPESASLAGRFNFKANLRDLLANEGIIRSVAKREQRESDILVSARKILEHVDAFFLCWELLDELCVVGQCDSRIVAAVQSQLSNGFLRTHIEPALLATMASMSQANTTISYLTDLITITHSSHVLDALFMVLLGSDLAPERAPQDRPKNMHLLSKEDQELLDSIEDEALRAEAAALLLPPGFDLSTLGTTKSDDKSSGSEPNPLRATLISWMTYTDNTHLSLNTLRLFDTILSTMNQFAYTSLALRNFLDEPAGNSHAGPKMSPLVGAALPAASAADSGDDDDEKPLANLVQPQGDALGEFYSGPAIGLGMSVAVDQELVRAVVERFLDASPSNISNAMPEVVVSAAIRIDERPSPTNSQSPRSPQDSQSLPVLDQQLEAPRNFQNMRSIIMREAQGCDEYVQDCLQRLRVNQEYIRRCWQSKAKFVRKHAPAHHTQPTSDSTTGNTEDVSRQIDDSLAAFYPGGFLASLVKQFSLVVKRHMAYSLMLTSMINKLACIADPALCAYLFLANSATLPKTQVTGDASEETESKPTKPMLLYDGFVSAAADAYVKSERVPKFSARLARQHREGVETAVRVGAAQRRDVEKAVQAMRANEQQQQQAGSLTKPNIVNALPDAKITTGRSYATAAAATPKPQTSQDQATKTQPATDDQDDTPLALLPSSTSRNANTGSTEVDESLSGLQISNVPLDSTKPSDSVAKQRGPATLKQVVALLGTPIRRFVHGYIVLDEFGKEMAATALALHTLELDRAMDRVMRANALGSAFLGDVNQEEYADLLDYYDPEEPAYRRAEAVKESLRIGSSVIDLSSGRNHPHHDRKSLGIIEPSSPTKVRKDRRRGSVSGKSGRNRSLSSTSGHTSALLVALEEAAVSAQNKQKQPTDDGNDGSEGASNIGLAKKRSSSRRRSRRKSTRSAQQLQQMLAADGSQPAGSGGNVKRKASSSRRKPQGAAVSQ